MSKICPNCNKPIPDGTTFCVYCGAKVSQGGSGGMNYQNIQPPHSPVGGNIPQELQEIVVDRNERYIDGLNDSAIKTFATGGGFGTNKIFFTNKRFYAKMNRFSFRKGIGTSNYIIPIDDITGVHLIHSNPIQWIIMAVISLIIGFVGVWPAFFSVVVFSVIYFFSKGTYMEVAYLGTVTELSVKMYKYNTVLDFQKKLSATIK